MIDRWQNESQPTAQTPSSMVYWLRVSFLVVASLFAAGVVLQVFLAGAGVLVHPRYFALHSNVAHILELLPLPMLLLGVLGRLPRSLIGLSALLWLLFMLQYVFLYALGPVTGLPVLRALHAVNALGLFWITLYLLQRTWSVVRAAPRRRQQPVAPPTI